MTPDRLRAGIFLPPFHPNDEDPTLALQRDFELVDGQVVTHKSDWFELREGRLQLRPYTRPRPHVAIASAITPTGGTLAGRYGLGLLCVAASGPAGYDVLDVNWAIANKIAAEHGQRMEASDLRLLAPIHVADTREQAVANVQWGFDNYLHYSYSLRPEGPIAIGLPTSITLDNVEDLNRTGKASIGTPDDAVAMLERFWQKTGGFGCILMLAHNWANFEATKTSYELFMRYVLPKFAGRNVAREESLGWIRNNREEFSGAGKAAVMKVVNEYLAEEAGKTTYTAAE